MAEVDMDGWRTVAGRLDLPVEMLNEQRTLVLAEFARLQSDLETAELEGVRLSAEVDRLSGVIEERQIEALSNYVAALTRLLDIYKPGTHEWLAIVASIERALLARD